MPLKSFSTRDQRRREYYPFGLQTSNSWTRENSSNDYLYNAGNELNANSGWYETFFRGYDPTLGRFNQADPLAYASSSRTPYSYAFNDGGPIRLIHTAACHERGKFSYADQSRVPIHIGIEILAVP